MGTSALNNDRATVFNYLMTMGQTGSVTITINPVIGGMVKDDAIMVHDAPPRVVTDVVTKFQLVSLYEGGLLIPVTKR